jgi:hypothetical protein
LDAAVEVAGHHAVNETAPEAVTALEALLPAPLEALVEGLEAMSLSVTMPTGLRTLSLASTGMAPQSWSMSI